MDWKLEVVVVPVSDVDRGVEVTPIRHVEDGEWLGGNGWPVQEKPAPD